MASKALSSPLVRHVSSRGYAQAAPAAAKKAASLTSSVSSNKITVAAYDNGWPVAKVTVAFRAGSRYEPVCDLGISHVLRSSAGLSTCNSSGFLIGRKLAQAGACVTVSGDREFIYYTVEASHDNLQAAVEQLNNIISAQEFRPWELDDNVHRLKHDLATLSPQVRAVDLLHKAAFRRGLGNSLFISPKKIGKISTDSLLHYFCNTLTPSRCTVTVVGDCLDRANLVAQQLKIGSGDAKSDASVYHGGEMRKEMGGDLAHVAIAVKGAGVGTQQSLGLAIAAKALGNGPVTKWGADHSPLAQSIGNIGPFAAAGFNVSYSDNGLFGVVLSVPKDEANCAVKAVAKVLKSGGLSDAAITAGKNQLKLQVLSEYDDGASLSESLAAQALYTGKVRTPAEIVNDINNISSSAVNQVMAEAAKSRMSMGAAGNLAFVPWVDEL